MAKVHGRPMVETIFATCEATGLPTFVATDCEEIRDVITADKVIMTSEDCRTGTDRVAQAVANADIDAEIIINVQCDMPFITPQFPLMAFEALRLNPTAQWATLYASAQTVVLIGTVNPWFERVDFNQHIGVYAFTKAALKHFASLPESKYEARYNLEQMRLVENGIDGVLVEAPYAPLEVNTTRDLQLANSLW